MKIVNPLGQTVQGGDISRNPRGGCICYTYESNVSGRSLAGNSCFSCGCNCQSGNTDNLVANRNMAANRMTY
ncbi:hypothetical protein GCM10008904_10020 [Paraclostridium ghonii]|uniref:Bacteriocin n=1 Tax=Paraclostridium ghonii TaxID=29358 RepID=A0ABU0MZ23_9FIRM|nr:hypothetical protein [Paeniclostridium ghonii]MDQ0555969.1 putative bacteriocin precursor [Paeniclostridium ghonii]